MLLISPSGFHQSCSSPDFIVLRASVNEGEGSLYPSQQLQMYGTTVNEMIMKRLTGGGVPHDQKQMSKFLQENCASPYSKELFASVHSPLME